MVVPARLWSHQDQRLRLVGKAGHLAMIIIHKWTRTFSVVSDQTGPEFSVIPGSEFTVTQTASPSGGIFRYRCKQSQSKWENIQSHKHRYGTIHPPPNGQGGYSH